MEINKISNIRIVIVSFEKNKNLNAIKKLLNRHHIIWYPLKFTYKSFFLIKILDFFKVCFFPLLLNLKFKFSLIHCRGHFPAIPGYLFKLILKKKFIFDFRGLWADERVDNQSWDQKKFFYRSIYSFFKYLEKIFFDNSDAVVVLTKRIKYFLINNNIVDEDKLFVIPCVADYDKFHIMSSYLINLQKKRLKLSSSDFIIGYFGSITKIYSPDKMISFFLMLKKKFKKPKILFLSDNFEYLINETKIKSYLDQDDYMMITPENSDLSKYYNICDATICFVIESFARIASSPVKLAESLACGTPVIVNRNVGDLNFIIPKYYRDGLININIQSQLESSANKIFKMKNLDKFKLRKKSKVDLCLSRASRIYNMIYNDLLE